MNWPPKLKRTQDLKWGVSPFDDLSREDLLKMLAAYHSALTSCRSAMKIARVGEEYAYSDAVGPYLKNRTPGGNAMAKANFVLGLSEGTAVRNGRMYRNFFRHVEAVLFPEECRYLDDHWWICDKCKVMVSPLGDDNPEGPCHGGLNDAPGCPKSMRRIEWDDIRPQTPERKA